MRIIHASDLHLGRPLRGILVHPNLDEERFRHVGERALERLVDQCIEARAALLLIAGDLTDHWMRNYQLGLRLVRELLRLESTPTRVYWVRGNHDAENRVIRNLLLPSHVSEIGLCGVQTLTLPDLGVALTGTSFAKRRTEENLFASFPAPIQSLIHIGLLHTSADGLHTGDSYAPCGRRELVAKGYQYMALGHVHEPLVLSEKVPVAYSGCLQGRHFAESGARGCRLVEIDGNRVTSMTHVPLDVVRFGKIDVDVSNSGNLGQVSEQVVARCRATLSRLGDRALVARVCLKGRAGIEALLSCSAKLRSTELHGAAATTSERLSIDGFWAQPDCPNAPCLRLDDETTLKRRDF